MKLQNTKGFTLIELLVVIAIIGILATGATATYTSQLQKARDTTRITDVQALKAAIEQEYQDASEYPSSAAASAASTAATCTTAPVGTGRQLDCLVFLGYLQKLPKDSKSKQTGVGGTPLDYTYTAGPDINTVAQQEYEVSTGLENTGNATSKGANDSGNNTQRLEVGVDVAGNGPDNTFNNVNNKRTSNGCTTIQGVTTTPNTIWIAGPCLSN